MRTNIQSAAITIFLLTLSPYSTFANTSREAAPAPTNAPSVTFDLIHTQPECKVEGKSSTWCKNENNEDNKQATARAGMVERINGLLDTYALNKIADAAAAGSVPKVYVAYLSFSNTRIKAKLCELGKAGIPLRIVLDNGSRSNVSDVENCSKDPAKPNVKISFLGGLTSSPWRLHHNKYLVIDPGDGSPLSVNFSSGNLSTFGTGLHLDHWVLMTAPQSSNLVNAQMCVIQGVDAATELADKLGMYEGGQPKAEFDSQVADQYITSRDACYIKNKVIPVTSSEAAIQLEGVAPAFSPNNNDEVFQVFQGEVRKVIATAKSGKPAYLYIAIQHFLHDPTARLLREAADAGVDVRIVMDDDVVEGTSEVSGVTEFYKQYLKGTKIKVRFAQTNAEIHQLMHNKLTILNGKRTFSGAGHFTYAALQNNWENFYLIENEGLAKKYITYFREIWMKSVDEAAVKGGRITTPEEISPEALKQIGTGAE